MVKIVNEFGDRYTGKCANAIYQQHYGGQIRRKGYKETKPPSPAQIKQRNKFKDAIAWVKTLTPEQRIGLKNYYESSKLGYKKNMPVNWYNFAKYCYIKNAIFEIIDPYTNTYKILHPAIYSVTERASDLSVLFSTENLTQFENQIVINQYQNTANPITAYIEVITISNIKFTYTLTPAIPESKYFDGRFFDSRFFE